MLNYDNFSIRSIDKNDIDRILLWRNSEKVSCNMYSDHQISQQEHEAWFAHALVDNTASYLIFLHYERPIGFISFTNINEFHGRCYWAFYLGETDVSRGAGSVMEFFALDYAFQILKIRKLCGEVFSFNSGVIKLHEKFGFSVEGKLVKHYLKKGQYEDVISIAKFASSWLHDRVVLKNRIFGNAENE